MRDAGTRQVLAGLVTALVIGAGLSSLVFQAGRATARRSATEQNAVVTGAAATEGLAKVRAAGGDPQAAALALVAAVPGLEALRVIDSRERQLVASTFAADSAGGFPRRLEREQKAWFDQAKELEAAHSTNVMEGKARKPEVLKAVVADDRLEVVLPLLAEGTVTGSVQAVVAPVVPPRATGGGIAGWLVLGGAVAVLALLLRVLRDGRLRVVAGLVVTVVALWLFADLGVAAISATRAAGEQSVAARAREVRDALAALPGVDTAALAITDWNLDQYRAPRGTFDAAGAVDPARVAADFAPARGRFQQGAVLLEILAVAFYAWVATGFARRTWSALLKYRAAYGFVVPAMIGMIFLVFFPFLYGVVLSFTNQTLYNVNQPLYDLWVGVDNYISIVTDFDVVRTADDGSRSINFHNFYWTLGFTILWTVSNVSIGVTLGLILALILNTKSLFAKPLYRIILILPWAVPNYITALIWKGMFHKQFGVINQVIQMFGGQPISWVDTWYTSFFAVLATNGWLSFPFMMVISLGALQAIPADLYEAARVDGAGRWQAFRFVTLPSIKPALVPAVILSVVWTFNMFNIIYLVSQGEPAGATEILITDAYKIAFEQYRYGYAAAYSVVIFLILMAYGIWQNRVTRATEGI